VVFDCFDIVTVLSR